MVNVLTDLHLLDARIQMGHALPPGMPDSVLGWHGITRAEYDEAVRYYAERPERYSDLYDQVLVRLSGAPPEQDESSTPP
jgi:hypothetical protein